ncbi:hypothetical protein HMPREF3033_00671 [Veillonellaceae bacterium DNF00751]|nr:hypothetical protein HMPREF3033_00671 [Veillonellaceae bacterium DNF00751]
MAAIFFCHISNSSYTTRSLCFPHKINSFLYYIKHLFKKQ